MALSAAAMEFSPKLTVNGAAASAFCPFARLSGPAALPLLNAADIEEPLAMLLGPTASALLHPRLELSFFQNPPWTVYELVYCMPGVSENTFLISMTL